MDNENQVNMVETLETEIENFIKFIQEKIPDFITSWKIATPEEKKKAIVNVINKQVDVPFVPESVEAIAIGKVYDILADKLGL